MSSLDLPEPTTMTVYATFKNKYNCKISLPVYDGLIPENKNDLQSLINKLPNHTILSTTPYVSCVKINVVFKHKVKSVRVSHYAAAVSRCKSMNEASQIFNGLNLDVMTIREMLVTYKYDLPINVKFIDDDEPYCKLKYNKTTFLINKNRKVIQTSRNIKEAHEAYQFFKNAINNEIQ